MLCYYSFSESIQHIWKHVLHILFFLCNDHCPTVVFVVFDEGETVLIETFLDNGYILYVESAEEDTTAFVHTGGIGIHVGSENIAIDIGNNEVEVEMLFSQYIGISKANTDIIDTVEADVIC